MEFKDLSARLKKTRETQDKDNPQQAPNYEESYRIRGKMVGVLLRDARLKSGHTLEECARLLRLTPEHVEAWELGDAVPSLPQLEILAYFLDVPVSHFWGTNVVSGEDEEQPADAQREYLALRDRMIGALLRQARQQLNMSLEDLSAMSGISVERVNAYELGEMSLPMNELTVLANGVKKNINYFLESSSHIGDLLTLREQWKHFANLPDDIRRFAANPLNVGFIEIAIMLSQMPTDRLRKVGESVLNITM
jgi:transcriptional regulator with XRE-family HTH domain